MVVTEVRKYMEAAVEKLTPAKAQEMARSILQGQSKGKEQVQKVAQDLMDWSNEVRGRMREMVRREVARQLKTMGLATKDDLEAVRARVGELERARGAASGRTAAKRSAARAAGSPKRPAAGAKAKSASPSVRPSQGGS